MKWTKHKYRAVKTTVDGKTFDSKKEAKRYTELKLLEKTGMITHLELQPTYQITVNGVDICKYKADFRYFTVRAENREQYSNSKGEWVVPTKTGDREGQIIEDVKGFKTPIYRLKKKLVEACFPGTLIKEV
tara:strand:- start:380 stop:772 length:393 start_codon:yes stop_codon:yes gene_type:complete